MFIGEVVIDYLLVSRIMMFDINKRQWWEDIFEFVGVKIFQFLRFCYVDEIIGYLKEDVVKILGFKSRIFVVSGGGDRFLEVLGVGIVGSCVMELIGIVINVLMLLNKVLENFDLRVVCFCYVIRDYYLIEQGIIISGIIL